MFVPDWDNGHNMEQQPRRSNKKRMQRRELLRRQINFIKCTEDL